MKRRKAFFKASQFFRPDFPFRITRFKHTPKEFNDNIRCRREFWKIIYVESGSGWKVINSRRYPLKSGSLFVIHPEDDTTIIIETEFIQVLNILFMPELFESMLHCLSDDFDFFSIFHDNFRQEIGDDRRELLHVLESNREILHQVQSLEKEFSDQEPNYRNAIRLKLLDLLIRISRLSASKLRKNRHANVVSYVNHIIGKHYAEDFDLGFLAEKIGVDKSTLCRIFRTECGTTISLKLRQRRLAAAAEMLKKSSTTISEICYACGFNDLSYFYRAFKAETGYNPGDYRKKFGLY